MMSGIQVLAVVVLVSVVTGHEIYQRLIPNGDRVTDPCTGKSWPGVGHVSSSGSGDLNAFGKDFQKAIKENPNNDSLWWPAVCNKDSDEDGKSNGEELGDKPCTWRKGQANPSASQVTHPGYPNEGGGFDNSLFDQLCNKQTNPTP